MKNILKLLALFIFTGIYNSVSAADIASCSNPKGKSYYPEMGLVTKDKSGWTDDGISGGRTTVKKIAKDK